MKLGGWDFREVTLVGCEQQVGKHWTKEWFYCWNLITFIEMRDLQVLPNLILLPRRLTYSQHVRNAIFQMTSSPVTKSGSLKSAGSSPRSGVWDIYLVFPVCAGFFHSPLFNFKCRKVNSSPLSSVSFFNIYAPIVIFLNEIEKRHKVNGSSHY